MNTKKNKEFPTGHFMLWDTSVIYDEVWLHKKKDRQLRKDIATAARKKAKNWASKQLK